MYKRFKIDVPKSDSNFLKTNEKPSANKQLLDECKNSIRKYVFGENGELDGNAIQDDWFPSINCDIFISHSHNDIELANLLADWLYSNFGLTSFIDSNIWEYVDDLQKEIDDTYCLKKKGKYDYQKRNFSTSHVHLMLNMALMKMIDKTECLFFLNTPNSISLSEIGERTLSPWIFSEIGISQMIRQNKPDRNMFFESESKLDISYSVDLSKLTTLKQDILKNWKDEFSKENKDAKKALDNLYRITNPDLNRIRELMDKK